MSVVTASLKNGDVYLAQNQVANRVAFDTMRSGVQYTIARNNHDRIEKLLGFAGFIAQGPCINRLLGSRWQQPDKQRH